MEIFSPAPKQQDLRTPCPREAAPSMLRALPPAALGREAFPDGGCSGSIRWPHFCHGANTVRSKLSSEAKCGPKALGYGAVGELSDVRGPRPAHGGQASVERSTSSHPLPLSPEQVTQCLRHTAGRYTLQQAFSGNRTTRVSVWVWFAWAEQEGRS